VQLELDHDGEPVRKARTPKVLYVVCSTPGNPHSNGTVEVFTTRQRAERARRWSDQRLVEFVPNWRKR
jgi:hypothetical protein